MRFVSVLGERRDQVCGGHTREPFGCRWRTRRIHAQIKGAVCLECESSRWVIQLHRGNAEIGEDRIHAVESEFRQHLGQRGNVGHGFLRPHDDPDDAHDPRPDGEHGSRAIGAAPQLPEHVARRAVDPHPLHALQAVREIEATLVNEVQKVHFRELLEPKMRKVLFLFERVYYRADELSDAIMGTEAEKSEIRPGQTAGDFIRTVLTERDKLAAMVARYRYIEDLYRQRSPDGEAFSEDDDFFSSSDGF